MTDPWVGYLLGYYQECGIDVLCGEEAGAWARTRAKIDLPPPVAPPPLTPPPRRAPAPPPPVVRPPAAVVQVAAPPVVPSRLSLEEKRQILTPLAADVAACRACGLAHTRTNTVFGIGTPMTTVVFIGEAPGADEDLAGEPFVGAAGKLLDRMLRAGGMERQGVYIANVLKCRPPGNREPAPEEIRACQHYLFRQLEVIAPRAIFTLGRFAILCLLGLTDPVGRLRGRRYQWRGIPVVASYHPAYYLRTPSRKKAAWEDLLLLGELLAELGGEG